MRDQTVGYVLLKTVPGQDRPTPVAASATTQEPAVTVSQDARHLLEVIAQLNGEREGGGHADIVAGYRLDADPEGTRYSLGIVLPVT